MLTILNRNLDSGPFCIIFAVAAAGGEDRVFSACPFCIPTAKNIAFIAETVLTSGKTALTFDFPAVRTVFPLPPGDRLKGGCRCRDSRCEATHPLIFHKNTFSRNASAKPLPTAVFRHIRPASTPGRTQESGPRNRQFLTGKRFFISTQRKSIARSGFCLHKNSYFCTLRADGTAATRPGRPTLPARRSSPPIMHTTNYD